jgi:hypothetical protein
MVFKKDWEGQANPERGTSRTAAIPEPRSGPETCETPDILGVAKDCKARAPPKAKEFVERGAEV